VTFDNSSSSAISIDLELYKSQYGQISTSVNRKVKQTQELKDLLIKNLGENRLPAYTQHIHCPVVAIR